MQIIIGAPEHLPQDLYAKVVGYRYRVFVGQLLRRINLRVGLNWTAFVIKAMLADGNIKWQRGHNYLTLVYQIDEHGKRLLWIGEKRKIKTLLRFFRWFGSERNHALSYACTDMWKPYLKVIAKKANQAIHILDRFHIMGHINKAIDEIRAQEARELKAKGYGPVLTKSRWLFIKRPENLTAKQESKLSELLYL